MTDVSESYTDFTDDKGKGNLGAVVMAHWNRLAYLGSQDLDEDEKAQRQWKNGILSMEMLLAYCLTPEYAKKKEDIAADNKITNQEWFELAKELMILMQKNSDLLPAERVGFYDKRTAFTQ